MNKREFYLKALKADTYLITAWNIACFSLVAESPEEWKNKPYPYRLVQLPNAHYFVNPENTQELVMIEDSQPGRPLFTRNELISLQPGELLNVYKPVETTYGNVLANQIMLIRPFGGKISFMAGRMSAKKVEKIVEERLQERVTLGAGLSQERPEMANRAEIGENRQVVDSKGVWFDSDAQTPVKPIGEAVQNPADLTAPIYVDEYLRFCDGTFSLVAYTQIFTPADTRKSMTAPPGIAAAKAALLKKYEGRLHDRAVVAEISEELQKIDAEHLKGDRSEDFLTSSKLRKIVRPRLFLMYGAETGIEEKVDVDLIENSLTEGWDITKFPEMNNALRAGSFNRGKQTELGGEAVKDLFRASGNLKISEQDCGSTVGLPGMFPQEEMERIIGFSVIENGVSTKITRENVGAYLGRAIKLRSPQTCKMSHTDYCATCVGDRLANNPTGMSMAVADYGSAFLAIYMSAAHSKGIQVARLNVAKQLM